VVEPELLLALIVVAADRLKSGVIHFNIGRAAERRSTMTKLLTAPENP
jgi:hypothetical protein